MKAAQIAALVGVRGAALGDLHSIIARPALHPVEPRGDSPTLQEATATPDPASAGVGVLRSLESVSERWAQRGERAPAESINSLISISYETSRVGSPCSATSSARTTGRASRRASVRARVGRLRRRWALPGRGAFRRADRRRNAPASGRAAETSADRATDTAISVVSSHTGSSDLGRESDFRRERYDHGWRFPSTDDRRAARTVALDPVLDSRKRPILKGGRHALHVYRHHHRRDSRFWSAATSTTLRFDGVEVSMRWTWGRAAPRRVGCART